MLGEVTEKVLMRLPCRYAPRRTLKEAKGQLYEQPMATSNRSLDILQVLSVVRPGSGGGTRFGHLSRHQRLNRPNKGHRGRKATLWIADGVMTRPPTFCREAKSGNELRISSL